MTDIGYSKVYFGNIFTERGLRVQWTSMFQNEGGSAGVK